GLQKLDPIAWDRQVDKADGQYPTAPQQAAGQSQRFWRETHDDLLSATIRTQRRTQHDRIQCGPSQDSALASRPPAIVLRMITTRSGSLVFSSGANPVPAVWTRSALSGAVGACI